MQDKNTYKRLAEYLIENQTKFYRLAYSYLADREDSLDAVQDAVCKAIESAYGLRRIEAVRTWFYRILVRECLDRLRARGRERSAPSGALDAGYYEDPLPQDDSLYRRVQGLPPEVRTVICLRFYEELSLKEISEATGWNLNTVKTRLYGGLRRLRVTMEGEKSDE
ncbi:MAG TPA: RNA polymerase sigma factor [Oscillospiraceae bacterium]|nr:RNA polymerase sigma factor [Oscillospiraceae bacterium]